MELRERSYAAYVAEGETRAAAVVALTLSSGNLVRGAVSVANGWLARAERLLGSGEEVEHGHLALVRGLTAMEMGETEAALEQLRIAARVGCALRRPQSRVDGAGLHRPRLVYTGEVEQGLALLDEATTAAVSGELRPLTAGIVYCVTIDACQALGDCGRAAQWTDEANRWCDRLDVTGFPGACRIHRAEILRLRGEWPKAEEQAKQACLELNDYNRWVTAAGFYEIGEIHRRRGEFAAAEEAYPRDG